MLRVVLCLGSHTLWIGAHHKQPASDNALASDWQPSSVVFTASRTTHSMAHKQTRAVSAVAVPFIASGLLARFWPAVRHLWQVMSGRIQQAWHSRRAGGETGEGGLQKPNPEAAACRGHMHGTIVRYGR
jgi:hypothetical protein